MMTFLLLGFIGLVVATVLFVVMLPLMIIGGVLRILTWPLRLLFRPWGCYHRGYGVRVWRTVGRPRWRRRGAFARW